MRMSGQDSRRQSRHNITRSLIEDGSEDFTNIEEHIEEDTKISCRKAVQSSLNNISTSNIILVLIIIQYCGKDPQVNLPRQVRNLKRISDIEELQPSPMPVAPASNLVKKKRSSPVHSLTRMEGADA